MDEITINLRGLTAEQAGSILETLNEASELIDDETNAEAAAIITAYLDDNLELN